MSASSIPNLNTLRRGDRHGRGRGRGAEKGQPSSTASPRQTNHNQDDIVQSTDHDAVASRLSAVDAGYLDDPFARLLNVGESVARRLPLMNRGTYVRTSGIDCVVDAFLSSPSTSQRRKQIVSLGAGSDTRYFRLKQRRPSLDLVYHEIDFETNTRRKIARLRSPQFAKSAQQLADIDLHAPDVQVLQDGSMLTSTDYNIHPHDLRRLSRGGVVLPGLDEALPTLIISECCLIYLAPDDADAVLQYFSSLFPRATPLAIVIFEPIRPHDAFGRTMVSNLLSRGIQLQTLEKYAGLQEQRKRLAMHGFAGGLDETDSGAEAADISFVWQNWIASDEKDRVDNLEWMDEVEEFVLLARHYCICWGWRNYTPASTWTAIPTPGERG